MTALQCQAGQVGAFTANGNSHVLAFSDRRLNPIIYIYTFPELTKPTELKGNDVVVLPVTLSLKQCLNHPLSEGVLFIRFEKL